jgi:hypothetical protein
MSSWCFGRRLSNFQMHSGALVLISAALLFSSHLALAQFSLQGPKLVGTLAVGAASQDYSVSLSADGNTAIVGGYSDNSNTGAAWVYTRSKGVWSQQGSKLVGTGAVGPAAQGQSVALSADGNTAIVGGSGDNSNVGAAWVYTRSGNVTAPLSMDSDRMCGPSRCLRNCSNEQGPSPAQEPASES